MTSLSRFAFAAALLAAVFVAASPAAAGCRRMGFTVNDYGKEGPTRDSKNLLDKHIATWATEQGIEKYSVGKKSVSCELFLNLVLFDEHTCTATATVCWGKDLNKTKSKIAKKKKKSKEAAAKKKAKAEAKKSAAAEKPKKSPVRTVETVEKGEKKAAAVPAALTNDGSSPSTQQIEQSVSNAEDSAAAAAKAAEQAAETVARIEERLKKKMETGAINPKGSAGQDPMKAKVSETTAKAAEAAADAAERAAMAAERAAAAAERAAQALSSMSVPGAGSNPSSVSAAVAKETKTAQDAVKQAKDAARKAAEAE